MKITLIREERESGKEAVSTQETDMLMEKLKTENKTGYITELRSIIPHFIIYISYSAQKLGHACACTKAWT